MASKPQGWNVPRLEFLKTSDNNMCCKCNHMLHQPMQTPCGHKICSPCVEELLDGKQEVPCPGNEEECDTINTHNVYPDFATFRELSRMVAYCPNKEPGCKVTGKVMEIMAHLEVCEFKQTPCPVEGCVFQGSEVTISNHLKVDAGHHVRLLNDQMKKLKVANQKETASLKTKVDKLEEDNKTLVRQLDSTAATLQQFKTQMTEMEGTNARLQQSMMVAMAKVSGNTSFQLSGRTIGPNDGSNTVYTEVFKWTISNYQTNKDDEFSGRRSCVDSEPFYCGTKGYKMCARVYLNGDGLGKGKHLSLYLSILKGENDEKLSWPFKHRVSMALMDQVNPNRKIVQEQFDPNPASASYQKPQEQRNKGTGFPLFAQHALVESPTSLVNDSIIIIILVDSRGLDKIKEEVEKN